MPVVPLSEPEYGEVERLEAIYHAAIAEPTEPPPLPDEEADAIAASFEEFPS